jgi:hypothetical protein
MQRMTTIHVLWNESTERDYVHRLSRFMATKISEVESVAEARVIVMPVLLVPTTSEPGRSHD